MVQKVAIITGGNSGIGYALADHLLTLFGSKNQSFLLCLACRNLSKAKVASDKLLLTHPGADISIVQLDTSNTASVKQAALEISTKFQQINWLFLNAGQLPPSSVNWKGFFPFTFTNIRHVFATGGRVLRQNDSIMDNGLSSVFATNVLGHYALIRELESLISTQNIPCHCIWTSSRSASVALPINIDNIQHFGGERAYENSKQLIDIISIKLNEHTNVFSNTACPGLVMTELTNKILPKYFWYLVWPLLFILRAFISSSLVISPVLGAYSLFWLSRQNPIELDANAKYLSCSRPLGSPRLELQKMEYKIDKVRVMEEIDKLYKIHFKP
ncbi:3-keto-steroid reductase isoform X1 [Oopsacas minuta]|uniref:3-keto-steroid reductase isoform X1 n=1 Tax=Oopsacas minuta TaxID=111878 RepID=A0AAV7KQH0_9METZ|nr:3-keto-steroid reductase isoform X1 [Oopsacas minuta]